MPRSYTAVFYKPDGVTVDYSQEVADVPDDVHPNLVLARVEQAAQQRVGELKMHDRAVGDQLKQLGKDALRGLGKAATGLVEGAAAFNNADRMVDRGIGPEGGMLTNAVDKALPTPVNDSPNRQLLRKGIEGATGALVGGPGGPGRQMFAGGMAGLGGELGARSGVPGGAVAGSLVGGVAGAGVGALATRARPQSAQLAREALEGITPQQQQAAEAFMRDAAQRGVSMDIAQALEAVGAQSGNLTTLRNQLAQSRHGNQTQQALREQPGQLDLESHSQIGGLPGRVRTEEQAANNVQQAATQRINMEKQARTAATRPMYQAAGRLDSSARNDIRDTLESALQQPGLDPQTVSAIQEAVRTMRRVPATGARIDEAADYQMLVKQLRGPYQGTPQNVRNSQAKGQLGEIADAIQTRLNAASPQLEAANARYAQISRDQVDPLKQGPVGTMAGKAGYRDDTQAPLTRFSAFLERGTDSQAGVSPIRQLGRELARSDPDAFSDAVKTYYSGKVQQAFKPTFRGGEATNADAAQNLYNSLFKNQKQWQGLRDAVSVSAEAQGLSPAETRRVIEGLTNYGQLVRGLSNRPAQRVGGLSSQDVKDIAGKSVVGEIAGSVGSPFWRTRVALQDMTMGSTLRQFDQIITSPEGFKLLTELSRVPVMSNRAVALVAAYSGRQAQEPGEEQ